MSVSIVWLILLFLPIPARQSSRQTKTILMWNSADRIETSTFGLGNETFAQHRCEFTECAVFDKSSVAELLPLDEYDAVLVHIHELWMTHMPNFQRQKHQRFVFLTQESPPIMNLKNVSTMGNIFSTGRPGSTAR
jgi:alpha-1,3-fucosyltransferase